SVSTGCSVLCRSSYDAKSSIASSTSIIKASAQTNANNDKAAAALRQVLSMQKTAKDKNTTAMGVVSGLNMINKLLAKDGIDLNNIVGLVIDMQATVVKPAKKAA